MLRLPAGHVAAPGRGVFATRALPERVPLLVYGGELVTDAEADGPRASLPRGGLNRYILGFSAGAGADGLACDAGTALPRCRAAYVNDARGSGAPPNCAYVEVRCGGGCACRLGGTPAAHAHAHAVLVTLRRVEAAEELTVSYGDPYWASMASAAPPHARAAADAAADAALGALRAAGAALRPTRRSQAVDEGVARPSVRSTSIDALDAKLLSLICEALPVHDRAAFGAVCRLWRSVAAVAQCWRNCRLGEARGDTAASPSTLLWRLEAATANANGGLESMDMAPLGQRCDVLADECEEKDVRFYVHGTYIEVAAATDYELPRRMRTRSPGVWGTLFRVARANAATLRAVRLSLNTHVATSMRPPAAWRMPEKHSTYDVELDSSGGAAPRDDDVVYSFWDPVLLAAAAARLPPGVVLTADVEVTEARSVAALLALAQEGRLRLDALLFRQENPRNQWRAPDPPPDDCGARLAAALSGGVLGAPLSHVVVRGRTELARAPDGGAAALHDAHVAEILPALAAHARALHTLELRDASPAVLRAAAAALGGATAFALRRLDVVISADAADAVQLMASALPPSLQALSVDVRAPLDQSAPLLAMAARGALERCPGLRVLRLATQLSAKDAAEATTKGRALEALRNARCSMLPPDAAAQLEARGVRCRVVAYGETPLDVLRQTARMSTGGRAPPWRRNGRPPRKTPVGMFM